MTNANIVWVMAVVLSLTSSPVLAVVHFNDGQIHDIDYHINESVWVDYQAPGMQTIVNLLYGGRIDYWLEPYENSRVNMFGGTVRIELRAYDSGQVDISGGRIGYLSAWDSSQVDISGGEIVHDIRAGTNGTLTIHGLDFTVDGEPFGYGELTSILGGYYKDEPRRHLTGTFLTGELIDNDFYIGYDASIVLVPEPATVLLLGLGGLALLRKRRQTNR